MRRLTVSQTIDAPRERVYDFLTDVANLSEFADHYMHDLRLERANSRGLGASYRFQFGFPLARMWGDLVLTELDPPHLIAAEGRMGRINRIPIEAAYRLTAGPHGMTKVSYSFESHPSHPVDHAKEALGMRLWMKLQARRSLRRLAAQIEHPSDAVEPIRAAAG